MAYSLSTPGGHQTKSHIKRFDPRFWTVDFPRPMMAAATTPDAGTLRIDAVFYKANDLAGIIWESEDTRDHPLLGYETARDFGACTLRFRWQSGGVLPLDVINGPTLTIEGRDADGAPRAWYVRLWNYAQGTPVDAIITIDFAALNGGFMLPAEAVPVYPLAIDRMFISLVAPGYSGTDEPLAAPVTGWAILSDMVCDGAGSVLSIGDVLLPPHTLSIASGYDDSYNLTPARLLRAAHALGYRGAINHYVGMSHYFRLERQGSAYLVSLSGGALNTPCAAWHADFFRAARTLGYGMIVSLSYELFEEHCWNDWKQRAANGDPARTGYTPPSTLLSPASAPAMGYLQAVARAFVQLAVAAGHAPRFQVGEPWWWVMPDGRICLYDDAARAAFGGNPVAIPTVNSPAMTPAQTALLDAAGALLASSTLALTAAVRADHPACQTLLLVYLPSVLSGDAPEVKRANVPIGWAAPAFDVLQLEDYDWVTTANRGASARGLAAMTTRLGYPVSAQHYLAGFVLSPADAAQWAEIDFAAEAAHARGVPEVFIWALPQVLRDGYTHFDEGDAEMQAFDAVDFPLALGAGLAVTPTFSTAIVTSSGGHEQRNADWASARMTYDAGPGIRSEADLQTLIAFFRARRGAAKAFRLRDPFDHSSNAMTGTPTATDQLIGAGDGITTRFALVKRYGMGADAEVRSISQPEPASVMIAVAGIAATNWSLSAGGMIDFAAPPPPGAAITAGFRFDVPVRFAQDSLTIDSAAFRAGEAASVPLIEVRP